MGHPRFLIETLDLIIVITSRRRQLFCIARIVLTDKTRLVNIPPARFMRFDRNDWKREFFKTYHDSREAFVWEFARQLQPHLGFPYLVVFVLHSIQCIYQLKRGHSSALKWMILATSVTFSPCHPSSSITAGPTLPSTSPLWRNSRAAADPSPFHLYRCDPTV
ncbi:hypothetical protein F5888DRAFT_1177281 [Russula emetica]|nr:hypothetical protein F5888DRAFT_1177281 [Russula emetica]